MATNIWDEFDKAFDTEALAKDAEDAAENGGRREVPHDTYEIAITKLELGKSKSSGNPMVICWMKILEGEYKGSLLFMNQPIHAGFGLHKANEFLRSLCAEMDQPPEITFKSFRQYGEMLMDIAEAIDNNFEYSVRYYDNKGYNAFEIVDVYPLEG